MSRKQNSEPRAAANKKYGVSGEGHFFSSRYSLAKLYGVHDRRNSQTNHSKPISALFNAACPQDLTSPEKCLVHIRNWAEWGWLDSLHECNECMSDSIGLSRCGIETDFCTETLLQLNPDSPHVKYQNALAKRLHTHCHLIVALRAASLVERCHYYPYRLVSLTSPNPSIVKGALIEFERDVKAWWAAKDRSSNSLS